jgi:hypothetical protein
MGRIGKNARRASGLRDPQAVEGEQGDERVLGRCRDRRRPAGLRARCGPAQGHGIHSPAGVILADPARAGLMVRQPGTAQADWQGCLRSGSGTRWVRATRREAAGAAPRDRGQPARSNRSDPPSAGHQGRRWRPEPARLTAVPPSANPSEPGPLSSSGHRWEESQHSALARVDLSAQPPVRLHELGVVQRGRAGSVTWRSSR